MNPKFKIDAVDDSIVQLLTSGRKNKEISSMVNVPRSTIQRRIRNLTTSGLVVPNFQISYEQLGFKSGLINIFVGNGDIHEIAKKVLEIDGMISVEIHIGNFDIIGHIIYEDGQDLLNMVSTIKKIAGVRGVQWSERVYQIVKRQKLKPYRDMMLMNKSK